MAVRPFSIGPWPGGVNLVDPPKAIPGQQLIQCLNWRLDPLGFPLKRPGHKKYGSTPAKVNGDNYVNFLARFYKNVGGLKELLAASNQKLFKGNDTTGAWTQINIDGSAGNNMGTNLCDWFVYKDRIYIIDGIKPQRYNGTNNVYAGHFIHDASAWTSTPSNGAGLLANNGVYKYVMTNVQGDLGEGPIGPVETVTMGATDDTVTISGITDMTSGTNPRHETTSKRIYRTKDGGSIFFLIAELAPNATGHTDLLADSALVEELILTHKPRDDSRFGILGYDERVYWFGFVGLEASKVEASDPGFPDRILDSDFFYVNNNDGDQLTGGGRVPSGIVFFKRNSMWLSRGIGTPIINISPIIGCLAPIAIQEVPGGIVFISQQYEVYFYDGIRPPVEIGRQIRTELEATPEAALQKMVCAYHDFRYILAYDLKGANNYNKRVLEYDFKGGKWEGPHENADKLTPSCFAVFDSARDKGELFWGESKAANGGFVYQRDGTELADDGVNSNSTLKTGQHLHPEFDLFREVLFSKAVLKAIVTQGGSLSVILVDDNLNVETPANLAIFSIPLPTNVMVWGRDPWGVLPWGAATSGASQVLEGPFSIGARGKLQAIKLTDNASTKRLKVENLTLLAEVLGY